ncbi:nitrilase-related carbon-nitrogen hydrolase [Oceanithermus sp.]
MRVYLAAVQAQIEPRSYRSASAFQERTLELARQAVASAPPDIPRVVAFPEAYALPLLFWLDQSGVPASGSSLKAALGLLLREISRKPAALLSRPWPDLLYRLRLPQVWPAYRATFAKAARETGSYIVGGSLFGPLLDEEPARGLHLASGPSYNWLAVFSPGGKILARPAKMRLTSSEKGAFLREEAFGSQVLRTRIGTLGVLICLDAFHESLVERVDAVGAWLLVQPSANAAAWDGPWSADASQIEGEVWLREGLVKKLEGRENLRYGVNPMLNGDFFDLHFEGRSSIARAGELLALADSPLGDAVVTAVVEVDPRQG